MCIYTFEDKVIAGYTSNDTIISRCKQVMHLIIVYLLVDSMKGVFKGTGKAMGLYKVLIAPNLFCSWIVNLILVGYFAFYKGYGLIGIWLGKTLSDLMVGVLYHMTIEKVDWE